jgi:hypothetical protein
MSKRFLKIVWILTLISIVWIGIALINSHDTKVCYTNIEQIKIGENVEDAILQMKSNIIWFRYKKAPCNNHDTKDQIINIIFLYQDNDPVSHQPNFCYSKKTGKIISIDIGFVG